ncbi:MAG TPA: hypothetical protein VGZ02_00025 [Candidatus Baltobacteraceae bacterium]|jgi:hypothetical protein|nr:hypothetical protein [Candidatus Baltobacteraceae bacterium]
MNGDARRLRIVAEYLAATAGVAAALAVIWWWSVKVNHLAPYTAHPWRDYGFVACAAWFVGGPVAVEYGLTRSSAAARCAIVFVIMMALVLASVDWSTVQPYSPL